MTLGIIDKHYASKTAGSDAEHSMVPPDLFTAETPLGTYQGMPSDSILFASAGIHHNCATSDGGGSGKMVVVSCVGITSVEPKGGVPGHRG